MFQKREKARKYEEDYLLKSPTYTAKLTRGSTFSGPLSDPRKKRRRFLFLLQLLVAGMNLNRPLNTGTY
jgi:hypothetical protein